MSTNGNDYRKANMEKARNARKSKTEIRNAYEEQIRQIKAERDLEINLELEKYKQTEYEADRLKIENISSVINKDAENYFNRIIEEKERTIELLKEMLFRNNEKPKEVEKERFSISNPEDYAMAKQMKEYKEEMRRRGLAVIANETFSGF
jgi:hypothetical protein